MAHNLSAILISGHPGAASLRSGLFDFGQAKVYEKTAAAFAGFTEVILVIPGSSEGFQEPLGGKIVVVSEHAGLGTQLKAGVGAVSPSSNGFAIGMMNQALLEPDLVNAMAEKFLAGSKKILVPVAHRQIGQPAFYDKSFSSTFAGFSEDETAWSILRANDENLELYDVLETSVLRSIEDIEDYHAMLTIAGLPVPDTTGAEEATEV